MFRCEGMKSSKVEIGTVHFWVQEDGHSGKLDTTVECVVLLRAVCGIVFITVIGTVWLTGRIASKGF